MKPKFPFHRVSEKALPAFLILSASSVLTAEDISITAPTSFRAVAGTTLEPLSFTATNLVPDAETTFDLSLSSGSAGTLLSLSQPDSAEPSGTRVTGSPFTGVSLLAGNTGTISAGPDITGVLAGQSSTFGVTANSVDWASPVTSDTSIDVVSNRLLTGSTTIDAGRHIAGLQSIGSITLNGGALTGSEGTNISVHSGGYAQLSNGLRLTSATDFTFNDANQTHDLQISYNRPTGAYNISSATLPGAGDSATNYTDASGNRRQDFGGSWKTSAGYGNILGQQQTFTEDDRISWNALPGNNRAWREPGVSSVNFQEEYVYNQELADTPQPVIPDSRPSNSTPSTIWELERGAGVITNERVNPLISGEVIQGSSLDLSGIDFNVTGTAVTDRRINGGTINLGRRMLGSENVTVSRTDTVTLDTIGSDEHRTRLELAGFSLDESTGVTASHAGPSSFNSETSTAEVQVTGDFTIDTSVAGRVTRYVDAGSHITGEGLAGENVQSGLGLGYAWNNVENNTLVPSDLLVIDSNTRTGSRTHSTFVSREFDTDTHTEIGWTGNSITVEGAQPTGLSDLGNRTVTPIAEGLEGETLTAPVSFNARYASVATAAYTVTHDGSETGPLTDGDRITLSDTGSGIYQNDLTISSASITGGQNLDYEVTYGGGLAVIDHGDTRTFDINYTGDTSVPTEGELGRISRAAFNISLGDRVNESDIISAAGVGRTVRAYTDGNFLETRTFALETRFDAPAATTASSTVPSGTDFGVNGLSLGNTTTNTSSRFTKSSDLELLDSETLGSGTTVQVEFIKLDDADPAVVSALETGGANDASLAGIYQGGEVFASEIVELTGLDGVQQVLQLGYDPQGFDYEDSAQLLWRHDFTDGGEPQVAWINSVLGNSNITMLDLFAGTLTVGGNSTTIEDYLTSTRHEGSYAEYLAENTLADPELGAWGVDTESDKVWAVIDHNSSFGAVIPEPSAVSLFLIAAGGLLVRRRRA